MAKCMFRTLSASLLAIGGVCSSEAETMIDDFSTSSATFGDAADGDQLFDQTIGGTGIATSRDNHTQLVIAGVKPGQVTGGQLVITDLLTSSFSAALFSVYDQHGDNAVGLMPTMPGGPYDLTGITEFRIDASELVGSLSWYFAVGWSSGAAGSSTALLHNGINVLPITAVYSGVDWSTVESLQFGVINYSTTEPASVKLDNFRIDVTLAPEPNSLMIVCVGGLLTVRRRLSLLSF